MKTGCFSQIIYKMLTAKTFLADLLQCTCFMELWIRFLSKNYVTHTTMKIIVLDRAPSSKESRNVLSEVSTTDSVASHKSDVFVS